MPDELNTTPQGKVLNLTPGPDGSAHEPALAEFAAYWQRMRRDGDVPLRTEIDPRGIEALLSNAFIAERIAPGLARLRIAGAHLSDVMGMEVRGMPLSSLIEPADRDRLADALVELFDRPAILRIELAAAGGLRRAPVTGTMLILPLRSDLGDISRALGCFVTTGAIGPAPRRFRITHLGVTALDIGSPAPRRELAEDPAPFQPATPRKGERPYLKLVHSR